MIIRSQDKKRIINFNQCEQIGVYGRFRDTFDDEPNIWTVEARTARLGAYSSEEKAIAALDYIKQACWVGELQTISSISGTLMNGDVKSLMSEYAKEQRSLWFDMPQDDEVEV